MAIRREALAARREAQGYTQESLAHRLGVELSTVGRWERGTLTPQPWRRPDLANALELSLEELDALLNGAAGPAAPGALVASRRDVIVDTAMWTGAIVADRWSTRWGCYSGRPQTEAHQSAANVETVRPDRAPSYGEAVELVTDVHRRYQAAQYGEVARTLPSLAESVDALVADGPADLRQEAFTLQCSVSIAAAKLATKAGDGPTGLAAADHARTAAEAAEDPFGQAAAAYQRTCALLRLGQRDEAERTAVASAEAIHDVDPQSLTWRGALTLISSIIAARRNDPTEAGRRLDHAEQLAERLGMDGNIGWTAFGPTNVRIHRMSVAVALDDPRAALAIAEQIDVSAIPAGLRGRQAQFHLDSAWAHHQLHEDPFAMIHLLDTERVAPELVLANHNAHTLIRDLLARERRKDVPGLRALARRAGVLA